MVTARQRKEIEEHKKDLQDELKTKVRELEENKARLECGFSNTLKRYYKKLQDEIDEVSAVIKIKQIEMDFCRPINAHFEFENDGQWQELNKIFAKNAIKQHQQILIQLLDMDKKIKEDNPILEKRIKEIEKELK